MLCLAWPKPMGGVYFGGDTFPSPHITSTNQEALEGSCPVCIKKLMTAAQLNLPPNHPQGKLPLKHKASKQIEMSVTVSQSYQISEHKQQWPSTPNHNKTTYS